MNDKDLDKLFRERLTGVEPQPSPRIWENIEAELDAGSGQSKVRKLTWLKYAAAAIAVVGIGVTLYVQPVRTNNEIAKIEAQKESSDINMPTTSHTTQQANFDDTNEQQKVEILNRAPQPSSNQQTVERFAQVVRKKYKQQTLASGSESADQSSVHVDAKKEQVSLAKVALASLDIQPQTATSTQAYVTYQTVEVAPIRPLIDIVENEETMLASGKQKKEGLVSGLLNKISGALSSDEEGPIRFSNDEEGSFRLDINNGYAKNRLKRR